MSRITSPVPLTLDKERHLLLDFNAACEVENVVGVNPYLHEFWTNCGPTRTRAVLWGMLLHESPRIKIEQVGSLIQAHMDRYGEISDAILEAYKRANGVDDTTVAQKNAEKDGE
jgi:hypothetical protein